jgi:hypothetical protein
LTSSRNTCHDGVRFLVFDQGGVDGGVQANLDTGLFHLMLQVVYQTAEFRPVRQCLRQQYLSAELR